MKLDLDNPPDFHRWQNPDLAARFATSQATRSAMAAALERVASGTRDERSLRVVRTTPQTLEERLFAARAEAKIEVSKVAMWMNPEWRNGLFRQLDSLLDPEEWDAADAPLSITSFSCFLRSMFFLRPARRPGLGIGSTGNLIATWSEGANKLTIEYLPTGKARWIVANALDGQIERVAGDSPAERLAATLNPYIARGWFRREHD